MGTLLVYSYFAPLHSHHAGGAQRFAQDLLTGLAARGNRIHVLAPSTDREVAALGPNVEIEAVLPEDGDEPISPAPRARAAHLFATRASRADAVLLLDRGAPARVDVPMVLSLNTLSYATELDAFFGLAWDEVVTPSRFLDGVVQAVLPASSWVGAPRQTHVVPYGVDSAHFRPVDGADLASEMGVGDRRCVIFPHRPDPRKGFAVALEAIDQARRRDPEILLLVPLPPASVRAVRDAEGAYVAALRSTVRDRGLDRHVLFHPWVTYDRLPEYFSLADRCLNLSTLPESFGLTPLESVACGTPVVTTRAGATTDLLPDDAGFTFVPFGDAGAVASALTSPGPPGAARGRQIVIEQYRVQDAAAAYEAILGGARTSSARYLPVVPENSAFVRDLPDGSKWSHFDRAVL